MRTGIYVRISNDPKGQGLGVARQETDCRAYADRKGWTVTHLYTDNDVSATKTTPRPAYDQLRADLDAGHLDAVVIWSYDRLCRRLADLEEFLDLIEAHKTPVGCVSGDLDLATPMGRTLARVVSAIAAGEIETLKYRLRRKQEQLAEQGKVGNGGRRPYGYTPDRMHIIDEEADIVREIAARILAGESLGGITRDLNDRVIAPARADQWVPTSVRHVVLKPHVAGLRVYKGEIVGDGVWPAILPRGTWEALRGILDRPRHGSGARRHLLSGIARCGECGAALGINYGGGAGANGRYRCTGCGQVARMREPVDEHVIAYILRRLNRRSNLVRLRRDDTATAHVANELEQLEWRRGQVIDDWATLGMTDADVSRALARIDERREELAAEQRRLRAPHVLDGLDGLTRDGWDRLPLARRRAVVQTLACVTIGRAARKGRPFDYSTVVVDPVNAGPRRGSGGGRRGRRSGSAGDGRGPRLMGSGSVAARGSG